MIELNHILSTRKVGDILLNYKEFAKEDWFKIYKCTCERRAEGRKEDEHEIWKFEEREKRVENLTTKTQLVVFWCDF